MVWRLYLQVTQVSGAVWIKGRVKHIHPDASVLWLPREARGPSVRGGQEPARLLPLPGSCDTGAQEQTCKCQLGEFICEASHSVWLSVPQRCRNFTYLNATWLIIANVIKLAQKKKKKKKILLPDPYMQKQASFPCASSTGSRQPGGGNSQCSVMSDLS